MRRKRPSIRAAFWRILRLRCPACGQSSIVRSPFRIREFCPECGALFKREEGFFVGAILVNTIATEAIILLAYLLSLTMLQTDFQTVLIVLFGLAIFFPVIFYHHSWSIWLTLDHFIEFLPES